LEKTPTTAEKKNSRGEKKTQVTKLSGTEWNCATYFL